MRVEGAELRHQRGQGSGERGEGRVSDEGTAAATNDKCGCDGMGGRGQGVRPCRRGAGSRRSPPGREREQRWWL
jgi:hypothetical protein